MKILITGGGNMGKSFAESFLNAQLIQKNDLTVIEKSEQQIEVLKKLGINNIETSFGNFIHDVDIIVLATKPQDVGAVYAGLKPYIRPEQIIISIMAGISIQTMKDHLGTEKIVRCMPNLPCQIGAGVTGFMLDKSIGQDESSFIIRLLQSTGVAIRLSDEDKLNAVTALSGSGPAYVFYFMQSMIEQAQAYGFSEKDAETIVTQTFIGAVELFKQNELSCKEWIQRVASKGGTTEAAIHSFNANNIAKNIQHGLDAALQRSRELK
jgi:pyrroline-5-carboxylate reductase